MKIIFHIGAGKTGTSSIQGSLLKSDEVLVENGIKYLGLMLEHSPVKLYPWQKAAATDEFLSLDNSKAEMQVENIIRKTIDALKDSGIHTIIWSNEWFFGRHSVVLNPMKRLEASGHEVKIVAYVRRHDAWAKSAYSQWGIKHKTYEGKIIPFREYIKQRPVGFSGAFIPWSNSFGNNFVLRNFDSIKDVVSDFCSITGISNSIIEEERINDSPGAEELILRALFNDSRQHDVMPATFERLFQVANVDFKTEPTVWLNNLLPSDEDLEEVKKCTKRDRDEVNKMLDERGQPPLSSKNSQTKEFSINHNIAYSALFQMLERQALQIQQIKREIAQIKNSLS